MNLSEYGAEVVGAEAAPTGASWGSAANISTYGKTASSIVDSIWGSADVTNVYQEKALPVWAIPAGLGVGALLLVVMLKKK